MRTPLEPSHAELSLLGSAIALVGTALLLLHPTPSAAQSEEPNDASGFLEIMASAEHATYKARQLVVYFGDPQSAAVLDVSSTNEGHFVRAESGDDVTRLWKRADLGLINVNDESIRDALPAGVPLRPAEVLRKYRVDVESPKEIVGIKCTPLVLIRRSDRATVERLWVHPTSGVVYRRELYGVGGKLVGMFAILDMDWGMRSEDEPMDTSLEAPAEVMAAATIGSAPDVLPDGYRLLRSYRIGMKSPADHWLYTDGIHALSVFRTPGGLRPPAGFVKADLGGAKGWVGPGPGTWAWEGGGATWVVVAEEPALDPARLTQPFPRGGPSLWSRLGSVWSRAFRAVGGLFS